MHPQTLPSVTHWHFLPLSFPVHAPEHLGSSHPDRPQVGQGGVFFFRVALTDFPAAVTGAAVA